MKITKIKEALIKAANWGSNLTERQSSDIPYSEAKEEKINEILSELLKGENISTPLKEGKTKSNVKRGDNLPSHRNAPPPPSNKTN